MEHENPIGTENRNCNLKDCYKQRRRRKEMGRFSKVAKRVEGKMEKKWPI